MKKQTVKEYANENYISKQAVYKKIDKGTLKTIKEIVDGKETIFIVIEDKEEEISNSTPIQLEDNHNSTTENNKQENNSTSFQPEDNHNTTPIQPEDNRTDNHNSTSNQPISSQAFETIISILKEQLEEKDKQIAERDKQIADFVRLLDQEQQLHAQTRFMLKEYQDKGQKEEVIEVTEEEEPDNKETEIKPEEAQEPKKKHNWFVRWLLGEN